MPEGGTRFNYWMHSGPGLTYRLDARTHLMLGIRYYHLSNADSEGEAHNPNINALEGYVGLLFTF